MAVKELIVFLILIKHFLLNEAQDLKITFWIDPVQTDIYDDIANGLKEIENLHLETKIRNSVLVIQRDNELEPENMNKFCEILANEGVSIVIDFTYQRWHEGIEIIQAHGIPYLRVDRILTPYLQAFGEFLQQKGANDVVLIFQNAKEKEEALYHMIEGFPFRTLLVNAADDQDFVERLKDLRPSPSYFAIFAGGTVMNSIFEKINKGKLFNRAREWHFVFLDPRDRVFKYKKQVELATKFTVNAKALCRSLQMKVAYCLSGFTLQRAMILEIFRSVIDTRQSNLDWLEPCHIECNSTESSIMQQSQFDLLENFRLTDFLTFAAANPNEEDNDFTPSLSYAVNININFFSSEHEAVTDLAVWQTGELRKINQTISPANRFFRIGTAESIPWNYYRLDPRSGKIALDNNGNPIWEGFCIDFINTLAEKLHFEYELVPPTSGKFGNRDPKTGKWDGIVGDLVSGETDFAVTALKMYSEREEVIDFIAPYFEQTGISIVIRKPVRQTSLFKFMTVLRLEVWLSIVAALVATAFMIWLMDKYSPYSYRNNREAYPYPCREFTLRESFWFALTSFTPQGGGEAPKAVSGRILVAAYWLFVVLMLATFTANLAAFLTVERMQTPVQSLDQLARQSRINYTVVDSSDTHHYFINMKFAEDTLYRMWKELALNASADFQKYRIWDYPIKEQYGTILLAINGSEPVRDAAEGFRKVNEHENADFAFIHDSSEIKYEITRNCNLTEVGEVFAEQPYAIAVQQGSHLADEFSYAILELQKDRYFEELKAKYWNYSRLKDCSLSDDQEGITLESLGGVFIATLFGLGLAMITLAVEVIYYKKKHTTVKKQNKQIIKVQPILDVAPKKAHMDAWHTGASTPPSLHPTPPPAFETITFRGRKVPPGITLGGGEFKPRRMGGGSGEVLHYEFNEKLNLAEFQDDGNIPNRDSQLPPYME